MEAVLVIQATHSAVADAHCLGYLLPFCTSNAHVVDLLTPFRGAL
ncbi:hypothetical protein CDS [Salmonella enterica subsp. enterica serovar Derby]|nr:hypothetical protein CDS [Salmonella enterica subsp. enterica serovar Derby]